MFHEQGTLCTQGTGINLNIRVHYVIINCLCILIRHLILFCVLNNFLDFPFFFMYVSVSPG